MKLLTVNGNPKITKGDKQGQYLTAILHLSPANLSGFEVCPKRSEGCTTSCLNTAGRGGIFKSIQDARKRKTEFFLISQKLILTAFNRKTRHYLRTTSITALRVSPLELDKSGEEKKNSILAALASGNQGAGLTRWGLINAYTAAAQGDHVDYEGSVEMERAGGQILELPRSQWETIAAVS